MPRSLLLSRSYWNKCTCQNIEALSYHTLYISHVQMPKICKVNELECNKVINQRHHACPSRLASLVAHRGDMARVWKRGMPIRIRSCHRWIKLIWSTVHLLEHLASHSSKLQFSSLANPKNWSHSSCIAYSKKTQGEEYGCLLGSFIKRSTRYLGWIYNKWHVLKGMVRKT